MELISVMLFAAIASCGADATDFHDWARTPPMGWNSWDCFGTTLTEAQSREQADMQAKWLLPAGYIYHTVDIQWYEPDSVRHWYRDGAKLEMDGYGRLLPAVKKFPSAASGKGFKPLADYVHSKGLKFAIHMMRGIPRQAVEQNTPVLGTSFHAKDIANVNDKCGWNPDKFGVDMTKPGAQEYYDSVFAQYAAWGVDFVKVDDIARPYNEAQRLEIEAIRKAIAKTGREIVLSLSPGDTPLSRGAHVAEHANMWRVCDDFWDRWEPLHGLFGRLHKWTEFRRVGSWPDADMLPFGVVDFGRKTRFTEAEQRTCMTLDCIARSPLIFGGDMTKLDKFTLDILTNTAVVAINQASENNRQLWRRGDHIVWTADVPGSKDKYIAIFNAETEGVREVDYLQSAYRSILIGQSGDRKADVVADIGGSRKLGLVVTDGGDGFSYDHAAWLKPRLKGPKGELDLTTIPWTRAKAGWGQVRVGLTTDGAEIDGIGCHATSEIIWDDIPEGYDTFTATGTMADGCEEKGSFQFVVLTDGAFGRKIPAETEISVDLKEIGFAGPVVAIELWTGKTLKLSEPVLRQVVKCHDCAVFRITPSH